MINHEEFEYVRDFPISVIKSNIVCSLIQVPYLNGGAVQKDLSSKFDWN